MESYGPVFKHRRNAIFPKNDGIDQICAQVLDLVGTQTWLKPTSSEMTLVCMAIVYIVNILSCEYKCESTINSLGNPLIAYV